MDRYSKIILTIIALCLFKISFENFFPPAEAQLKRRYIVVSNSDFSQFSQAVDDYFAQGWKLQGGITFHPGTGAPAQAMFR
jgi:hypothetical protein